MKMKWFFILLSLVFMSVSAYEIFLHGLDFGVDFLGGTKQVYSFKDPVAIKDLRLAMDELELGDVQVIRFGESDQVQYMVRAKYVEGKNVSELVQAKVQEKFGADKIELLSEEVVAVSYTHLTLPTSPKV